MPNIKRGMMGAAGVPTGPGAGSLFGWGKDFKGMLAQPGATEYNWRSSPVQIGTLEDWAKISASRSSLAVKTDGTLWSCGSDAYGKLGVDTVNVHMSSPVQIGSLTDWSKPYVTATTAFAIKTDGTLWGWGYNGKGNLGDNTTVKKSSPIQIGSANTWVSMMTNGSSESSGGILASGKLYTWGKNTHGALAQGDVINRSVPTQVGSLTDWASLSLTSAVGGAVKTDGTLWVWGYENVGILGLGDTSIDYSSPVQVGSLTDWATISFGGNHAVAVKTDSTLWTWGFNNDGQLGDNTTVRMSSPVQVGGLTTWSKAECFANSTLARKTDGTLWSWGNNGTGRLGLGHELNVSSPTQIGTETHWSSNFNAGLYVPMAITS